jgi:hypothetical protein
LRNTAYVIYPQGYLARAWVHDAYDATGHEKWTGPTAWVELSYNRWGVSWKFSGQRTPDWAYVEFAHLSPTGWHIQYDWSRIYADDSYLRCTPSNDLSVTMAAGWTLGG